MWVAQPMNPHMIKPDDISVVCTKQHGELYLTLGNDTMNPSMQVMSSTWCNYLMYHWICGASQNDLLGQAISLEEMLIDFFFMFLTNRERRLKVVLFVSQRKIVWTLFQMKRDQTFLCLSSWEREIEIFCSCSWEVSVRMKKSSNFVFTRTQERGYKFNKKAYSES